MQNAHDLRSLLRDAIEDDVRPHRYAAHARDDIIALAKLRTAIRDVCYRPLKLLKQIERDFGRGQARVIEVDIPQVLLCRRRPKLRFAILHTRGERAGFPLQYPKALPSPRRAAECRYQVLPVAVPCRRRTPGPPSRFSLARPRTALPPFPSPT